MIVFPDPQLSYSPSTLNLYDTLSETFKVTILSFEPDSTYSEHRILNRNIKYLPLPKEKLIPLEQRILKEVQKTFFQNKYEEDSFETEKAKAFIHEIRNFKGDIIAIDFFALWCAQKAGRHAHLLSLEIPEHDVYKLKCNLQNIKSVIIQSKERYNYLFGELNLKTFFIQNAPIYQNRELTFDKRKNTDLIYCGSVMPWFGVISCIEFIEDYPDYNLTLKGAVPPFVKKIIQESFGDLLTQRRLIIDEEYLDANELCDFLKRYYTGIVFYDTYRFDFMNKFNYKTAPSGKLFQYYNAGLPVIGNNLTGLLSIEEFNAGVIINSLSSQSIKKAVDKIETCYNLFANAAKNASLHFDFGKNIKPFISFLN